MVTPFIGMMQEFYRSSLGYFFQGYIDCPFPLGEFIQLMATSYYDAQIWLTLSSSEKDFTLLLEKPSPDTIPEGTWFGDYPSQITEIYSSEPSIRDYQQHEDSQVNLICQAISDFVSDQGLMVRAWNKRPVEASGHSVRITDVKLNDLLLSLSEYLYAIASEPRITPILRGFLCGGLMYRISQLEECLSLAGNYLDPTIPLLRASLFSEQEDGIHLLIEQNHHKQRFIIGVAYEMHTTDTSMQLQDAVLQCFSYRPVTIEVTNDATPDSFDICNTIPMREFLLNTAKRIDDLIRKQPKQLFE